MNDIRSFNQLGGIPPDIIDAIDSSNPLRDQAVEDMADNLLDDCKQVDYCKRLIIQHEMIEGCAEIMAEIANWTGRSDDSGQRIKKLHNLLANALHEVAESEVAQ